MPGLQKDTGSVANYPAPHNYLRSTHIDLTESYTYSSAAHPIEPEGTGIGANQKFLQRGEILAKITSGDEQGKVGVFQVDATDGRGDAANIVGINNSYTPWQLLHRDTEVAAVYGASVVTTNVTMRDATGKRVPVDAPTVAATQSRSDLSIIWK